MPNKNRPESEAQWEERLGREILDALWEKLLKEYPFLSAAVSLLHSEPMSGITAFATDGRKLFFPPGRTIELYRTNERFLLRALLHLLLHCLFGHLWILPEEKTAVFHISCDVFTEELSDRLDSPILKRPLSWMRQNLYREFKKEGVVGPEQMAGVIMSLEEEKQRALAREFFTDDHRFWPKPGSKNISDAAGEMLKKAWEEALWQAKRSFRKMGTEEGNGGEVLFGGSIDTTSEKRNYEKLLRRFSSITEETGLNQEEFDLVSYTYGLKLYQNVPLIEPLESREERRIKDFIIAVDTSYSTKGELVRGFLREAFQMLLKREMFSTGARVRLLQCDDRIRSDDLIRNREEGEALLLNFRPAGGQGTDFRPVFDHIEGLRKEKKIRKPAGLLYFTDGRGIYPDSRPDYPTAFLFLEDYESRAVPPWCIHLRLHKGEYL